MDHICRIPGKDLEVIFEKTGDAKIPWAEDFFILHLLFLLLNSKPLQVKKDH